MATKKNIAQPEILKIEKSIMGTISIHMKIKPMRKAQDFLFYPISKGDELIVIQSDKRIAKLTFEGKGLMSQSHQNGAYSPHLALDELTPFKFSASDWNQIKDYVGLTEGKSIGNAAIKSDNSGAKSIFKL